MDLDSWIRIFLAAYFTMVAVFYTFRLLLSKNTGKLLHHGTPGTRHWWGHMAFRVFRVLIWGVCLGRAFYPGLDNYLFMFSALELAYLQGAGVLMLLGGFFIAVVAHSNLAENWRSGIDPEAPSRLVTEMLYAYSRHPMYMGVMLGQVGFFLAMPSLFSLVCLVVGVWALFNQAELEDIHLASKFPAEFAEYKANVNSWLPGKKS